MFDVPFHAGVDLPRLSYRDGSRAAWWEVKDRPWYEREAWKFENR